MSLFKKPTRKFRQRISNHDSDDETSEKEHSKDSKPAVNNSSSQGLATFHSKNVEVKKKIVVEEKPKKLSLLSFDRFDEEEEETEIFKVKKSNYSRRLAKQRERDKKKDKSRPDIEEIAMAPSTIKQESVSEEPTLIVKPLDIPTAIKMSPDGGVLNGEEAEDMASDDEEAGPRFNPFKNALERGLIPDAATIFAVKKQRQMAREMGDFIPVDDTEKYEDEKSRLVRDDDNDRSDEDDENGRVNFSVNMAELERQKAREAFMSAQSQNLEGDDELENWEQEQIRKGVGIVLLPTQQQQEGLFGVRTAAPYIANYETVKPEKRIPVLRVNKDKSSLTTGQIRTRLKERLDSLKQVHRAHKLESDKYKDELVAVYDSIERLKSEGPELSQQFTFYQEMRAYIEDLCECMDLKLPKVDLLETKITDLQKTRIDKLISRRQQDVKDQAEEFSVLANKAMRGLSIDFLEDKPLQDESKSRRTAEREGRRMRRRKARDVEGLRAVHNDGMSTDDEEADVEVATFRNECEIAMEEARGVFTDVIEDFGTIDGVKSNFLKWRDQREDTYKDAYVSFCLPKAFCAFVRLELLSWNPLESKRSLESMNWHKTLLFYGWNPKIEAWAKLKNDPDANLIPGIVDKIVLPRLTVLVVNCWDPLSSRQTLKLVKTVAKLCQDSPNLAGNSKRLQEFLKSVVTRFQKSLEDDVYIPLYPKQLLENRSSTVAVFFSRQFWTSVKLLHNILTWHGILAEAPLQELALGCLLNRYIVLALQSFPPSKSVVEKCKTVVSTFPRAWFSGGKGIPQLDMLQRFIMQLAARCKAAEDTDTFNWCVREMISMLNTMGAQEKVHNLGKEFGIHT